MTTRRGFLKSILALAAAPAIVRAESLMRGKGTILLPDYSICPLEGDWTVEYWAKPVEAEWTSIAQVRENGRLFTYVNGILQLDNSLTGQVKVRVENQIHDSIQLETPDKGFLLQELRATNNAARYIKVPTEEDFPTVAANPWAFRLEM